MIREKSRCFLFVFLCGLLSIGLIQTPASAGERISQERVLQHAISSHSMSVGQVYQGQVELPGVEGTLLLLPPGQFEVVLFEITRNDNNSRLGHIILVNLIGNTVSAAVNLLYSIDGELVEDNPSTTGRSAMMGTRKSDRCDRRNMYFIQTYLNNQSGQDCFGLTHSIATLVGSEYKLNRKVGEKLISNGIS
jgi:hypothetical protein